MKITKRLWIGWYWGFKCWGFGRIYSACGCFIFDCGPLTIEYFGDACLKAQAKAKKNNEIE